MDPITSAELDSPSKTPLFLGIAAIVLAIAGLVIALMGFSKANELEAQLTEVSNAASSIKAADKKIAENSGKLDQVISGMGKMNTEVNKVLVDVQGDMKTVKKDIRSNTMKAGMAMKKVEELEAQGVKVVAAPKPEPIRTSKADGPAPVKPAAGQQIYSIKGGDSFSKVASRFRVSLSAVLAANPGVDPGALQIGQKIVIPTAK